VVILSQWRRICAQVEHSGLSTIPPLSFFGRSDVMPTMPFTLRHSRSDLPPLTKGDEGGFNVTPFLPQSFPTWLIGHPSCLSQPSPPISILQSAVPKTFPLESAGRK
jgi:hypothetical protein